MAFLIFMFSFGLYVDDFAAAFCDGVFARYGLIRFLVDVSLHHYVLLPPVFRF